MLRNLQSELIGHRKQKDSENTQLKELEDEIGIKDNDMYIHN